MEKEYKSLLENIEKNGLLPTKKQPFGSMTTKPQANIFSVNTPPTFGNLAAQRSLNALPVENIEISSNKNIFDGFDTDILSNSKFKKIDDKTLKMQVKIARLQTELEEHKKIVEASFLKADKNQYQKLLEIQQRMEQEIQKLVAEYQNRQLISVVFSPFVKLFNFIKSYVVLR